MNHFFHKSASQNRPLLYLVLSLALFLLALLSSATTIRADAETRAAHIAPHVLRFHIMANSDSAADQEIKLEIRSLVLDYLREHLSPDADKKATEDWLTDHRTDIETIANRHLAQNNFPYDAHLELTNCYFPTRYYDGLTFPCGNYDAARITLGKGKGHNWWCVLYPQFCLVKDAWKSTPESSRKTTADSSWTQQSGIPLSEGHRPVIKFRIKLLSLFHLPDEAASNQLHSP